MTIRRACENDLAGLNHLLYQVAQVHHLGRPDIFKSGSKKYTDAELLCLLKDEKRPVFVCEEEGKILCHLFCVIEEIRDNACLCDRRTLYIDDLCVDESCRSRGIGQKMYDFIKKWARENGFYNITLNVWSCNPSALRFYEKLGLLPQKTYMEEIL